VSPLAGSSINVRRIHMRNFLKKASLLTMLASVSASALETKNISESDNLNGLKVAVIKDALGSDEIIAGDYGSGLTKLISKNTSDLTSFERAMGVCAASIKLNELNKAEIACSQAIEKIDALKGRARHRDFLKSVAYSNRAIVRHLVNDDQGALDDFTSALLIDDNSIVTENLLALKKIRLNHEDKYVEPIIAE